MEILNQLSSQKGDKTEIANKFVAEKRNNTCTAVLDSEQENRSRRSKENHKTN